MTTLRCAIQRWAAKLGWRRDSSAAVSNELARDLGLPPEVVSEVLNQAVADLHTLARTDDSGDPTPILHKAISTLASYGAQSPFDEAVLNRCLNDIPEPHLTILRCYKSGMKQHEIATRLRMDEASVSQSLVKTYADLRMRMLDRPDDKQKNVASVRSSSHQTAKRSR